VTLRERLAHGSIPEPNSGCLLWLEGVNDHGYGRLRWDGRAQLAHRLSWAAEHGPAGRLHVLHKCDNPGCINPKHLRLGTQADNNADMRSKGRSSDGRPRPSARGESNGHAKHSEEIMLAVKDAGGTYKEIARRYGVSKTSVGYVKRGIQWSHLS
jgi:hypothetical protein